MITIEARAPARLALFGYGVEAARRFFELGMVRDAAELVGEEAAQGIQLGLEYAPAPPFRAGLPEEAPPHVLAAATKRLGPVCDARRAIIERLAIPS